jgi:hypothetical protein
LLLLRLRLLRLLLVLLVLLVLREEQQGADLQNTRYEYDQKSLATCTTTL